MYEIRNDYVIKYDGILVVIDMPRWREGGDFCFAVVMSHKH